MTVVLVDPRRPALVPVEAAALLAGDVQYTEEMPVRVPWSLPSARPAYTGDNAPVLLSSDPDHPEVKARLAAGEQVISAPEALPGERLIDAVAMMDKLRTDGPWESTQTHDSLRRYLLEETYELFDAVRSGNPDDVRDELGDVLLQVLFHARIAEDAPERPFGIDDVADSLLRKLTHRVPGVLGGEGVSLEEQLAQWDERKAAEASVRSRYSCLDGVPTGQPALALAQKVIQRVTDAGLPADLIPAAITSVTVVPGVDAESELRTAVLAFMDDVRAAERGIAAERRGEDVPEELDVATLDAVTEEEWRAYWPGRPLAVVDPDDELPEVPEKVDDVEELPVERHDEEPDPLDLPVASTEPGENAPPAPEPEDDEHSTDEEVRPPTVT
ncbi:nucleoside triphosphate pyrophosphohydrolase [Mycobacterium sp. MYCO198283]|uniref:nucleoside triphosphate pyrophosphohydrolase n=1 Tax=Mycobacterium sp. MYCO198283 TaxID=2883505 RepID=UPI001E511D71|nr:nucleoside triphosphate pyrophosphohydrolase [Mycobacterium sp. MYCO198283]MCG5430933.1 nucleoside triphosphate pyrophosphohydrolase [Mycobacterium sp. MYCO198283]